MMDELNSSQKAIVIILYIATFTTMWGALVNLSNLGIISFPFDEVGQELSNFPTRQVLVDFLDVDTTDMNLFTEDYDCTGFAVDLKENAKRLGYRIRVYAVLGDKLLSEYNVLLEQSFNRSIDMGSGGYGHALCKAYIIDEGLWVTIEPQGDLILNCTIGGK